MHYYWSILSMFRICKLHDHKENTSYKHYHFTKPYELQEKISKELNYNNLKWSVCKTDLIISIRGLHD